MKQQEINQAQQEMLGNLEEELLKPRQGMIFMIFSLIIHNIVCVPLLHPAKNG